MQRNDILIFDSKEANDDMKSEMKQFCSLLYEIGTDIKEIIVDTNLYTKVPNPSIEKTLFFGDDDYNNLLLDMIKNSDNKISLLMGHYFFLGNEKIFKNHFSEVIDEEEYVSTIQNSKYLLTASLQTAFESLACGNYPVLFKRIDKEYNDELISKYNIPVINYTNINDLIENFENLIKDYPLINNFEITSLDNVISEIKQKIELFNKLTQL
jgi:GMP synthase PP-ATPase subunit